MVLKQGKSGTNFSSWHDPVYGSLGAFKFREGRCLPYFSCTMSLGRFKDEISTQDEGQPTTTRHWDLEEVVQRELDQVRVEKEIVEGYLNDPESVVFYNSITVILTPTTDDPKKPVGERFEAIEQTPPIPFVAGAEFDSSFEGHIEMNVKGVQVNKFDDPSTDLARLRWDPSSVRAIAVDGQHRLASIKHVVEQNPSLATDENRIPVIFILAAPQFGFTYSEGENPLPIKQMSRQIFTNLNKTAEKVGTTRGLILDDHDLVATCVRSLMTTSTHTIGENKIPLSTIWWKDDTLLNKENWYANTIANLEAIVNSLYFGKVESPNPTEAEAVVEYFKKIYSVLGISDNDTKTLISQYGEGEEEVSLINFYYAKYCDIPEGDDSHVALKSWRKLPSAYVEVLTDKFIENHRNYVALVLMKLLPFEKYYNYWSFRGLYSGNFAGYHAQTKEHQNRIVSYETQTDINWKKNHIVKYEDYLKNLKKPEMEGSLLWDLIWQRGVLRAAKELIFDYGICSAEDYVRFINSLIARGLFTKVHEVRKNEGNCWRFFATNKNGSPKAGEKQEEQISRLVMIWYYSSRVYTNPETYELAEGVEVSDARTFVAKKTSGAKENITNCNAVFDDFREKWPMDKQIREMDKAPADYTKQEKEEIRDERISLIVEAGTINYDDAINQGKSHEIIQQLVDIYSKYQASEQTETCEKIKEFHQNSIDKLYSSQDYNPDEWECVIAEFEASLPDTTEHE